MTKLSNKCDDCGNKVVMHYNGKVSDDPQYCPFCSAYIISDDSKDEDKVYYKEREDGEEEEY